MGAAVEGHQEVCRGQQGGQGHIGWGACSRTSHDSQHAQVAYLCRWAWWCASGSSSREHLISLFLAMGSDQKWVVPDDAPTMYDSDGSIHSRAASTLEYGSPRSDIDGMDEGVDLAEAASRVMNAVSEGVELSLVCTEVCTEAPKRVYLQELMADEATRSGITLHPSQPLNTSSWAWKTRYVTDHGIFIVTVHCWSHKTCVLVRSDRGR